MENFKLITQEDPMGCSIACVASLLGMSYKRAKKLFNQEHTIKRGYYLKEITDYLNEIKLNYEYSKSTDSKRKYLKIPGSIVFIRRSKKYPHGHYLLKTRRGWMNSWVNFPESKRKAGFNKRIPGEAQGIIYQA